MSVNHVRMHPLFLEGEFMKDKINGRKQNGKIGYILLWLIGIPVPILVGIFLLRGCN